MKTMEFEGRTEQEAVKRAAAELGSESFDVEVIEKSGGFFGRSKVRIRVKLLTSIPNPISGSKTLPESDSSTDARMDETLDPPPDQFLEKSSEFAEGILKRMGYESKVRFKKMDGAKVILEVTSNFSNIIIGKKGKNLDALQVLVNVFFFRLVKDVNPWRIVIDTEGYRARQEEALIRTAHRAADEVIRTGSNRLLEPMNPFERKLIHTTIENREDVVTRSEGDGLYKRVKIIAGKARNKKNRNRR